ncbi:MAG: hypothetical protein ACE5J4_02365 [Candidatus Aenigmatarchaeota archaeon]
MNRKLIVILAVIISITFVSIFSIYFFSLSWVPGGEIPEPPEGWYPTEEIKIPIVYEPIEMQPLSVTPVGPGINYVSIIIITIGLISLFIGVIGYLKMKKPYLLFVSIFGIIFILIGLSGLTGIISLSVTGPRITGGGQVLSAHKVEYIPEGDGIIKGKMWTVLIRQNGFEDDYIVGRFTPNEIKDGDAKSKYDFELRLKTDWEIGKYDVTGGYKIIGRAYSEKRTFIIPGDPGIEQFKNECFSKPNMYWAKFGQKPFTRDFYCVWKAKDANVHEFATREVHFKTIITMKTFNPDESYDEETFILTTDPGIACQQDGSGNKVKCGVNGWMGDDVYVSFTGYVQSYEEAPEAKITHYATWVNGKYVPTTKDSYNNWNIYETSGQFESCVDEFWGDIESCVNEYNVYTDNAESPFPYLDGTKYKLEMTYNGEPQAFGSVNLNKWLLYPDIMFRIKADWIGVVVPGGKPEIISLSQPTLPSAEGTIEALIKNIGSGTGTFTVYVESCDKPGFTGGGYYTMESLAPGDQGYAYPELTAVCTEKTTATCKVKAFDPVSNLEDVNTTIVICDPNIICQPGERRCNENRIEECNSAGSGWSIIKTCEGTCEYRNGIPTCSESPCNNNGICEADMGETIENCPNDCKEELPDLPDYIVLLIGLGLFIGGIYKERKTGKGLLW